MTYRVCQTVISKLLVLMVSVAVIQIGVISAQTEGGEEKLALPMTLSPIILKNPCLLIKCTTPNYKCQVVNAESCCKANKICAECVPCPQVLCKPECKPMILENGCQGCNCTIQPLTAKPTEKIFE